MTCTMERKSEQRVTSDNDTVTTVTDRSTSTPTRRTFLRATAGVTAVTAGLGVVGSVGASEEYGTVVDIVEDFGADPTGAEPIDGILEEAVQNDTKVIFPEGEYYLETGGLHRNGAGTAASFTPEETPEEYVFDVALVGEGDVTLRPADGVETFVFALWGEGGRGRRFEPILRVGLIAIEPTNQ